MRTEWTAMFSKTGSEIASLASAFKRWPDRIITNNENDVQWMSHIPPELVTVAKFSEINDYLRACNPNKFITLHGYMKILPPDVCERHEIYNGHPGLISEYPELKGKDPQEKVWNNCKNYPVIGSVIHRVTAGIDEGEIVHYTQMQNNCISKEMLYNDMRLLSLQGWYDFLGDRI